MGQTEYLRFLIAAANDPDLRASLHRASAALRTLDDLAAFAARHGFRFGVVDIPLRHAAQPHEMESR